MWASGLATITSPVSMSEVVSQKFTSLNLAPKKVFVLPLLIREYTHIGHCAHGTPIDLHIMYDNRNARSD
jgi:hypothetical protein